MENSSGATGGRRAVSAFSPTVLRSAAIALLTLLGMTWSAASLAQTCDFVSLTPVQQSGPANSTVSFTLEAQTACNTTVDISIAIGTDSTGGAAVVPPTTPTIALDTPYTFQVTLGGTAAGTGTAVATCLNGGCAGDQLTFNFATHSTFVYTASGPSAVTTTQGTAFTLASALTVDSSPGTVSSIFSTGPTTVAPNGSGIASVTTSRTAAATYNFTATLDCVAGSPLGCSSVPAIPYTVTVEPTSMTNDTPLTVTMFTGDSTTMTVDYGGPTVDAPDGTTIFWSINPTGGGTFSSTNLLAGKANATFTPTLPGTYSVSAGSGCTFCTGAQSATFAITVIDRTLAYEFGDSQTSQVGTPYVDALIVTAYDDDGTGIVGAPGVQIDWLVTSGAATLSSATTTTDAIGESSITVTPTAAGPITISATRNDEPSATFTFNLTATPAPVTMTAVTADPANAVDGVGQVFTVDVEQLAAPVVGTTVTWTTTGTFTASAPTSNTGANGEASVTITPSAPGTYTNAVTASVDVDGTPATGDEASYSFDVTVAATPTLIIDAGDGNSAPQGSAFPTLQVLAEDSGVPAPGVTINWVLVSGAATIVPGPATNGAGIATATVTAGAPGPIVITAERGDAPGVLVTFNLTATPAPTTTTAVTPDPATMDVGVPQVFTVDVQQAGGPLAGTTVLWTAAPGFTLSTGASGTDANGDASVTVTATAAGSFVGAVTASVDPDAVGASGDESSHAFGANVSTVPTLTINGGNGQTGTVGTNFAQVLSVIAEDSGTPTANLAIVWTVTGGAANITPSGPTDPVGEAHLSVTPTAPGTITIRAERSDAPSVFVTFTLTAVAAKTLTAVTPNPAAGDVGTPMTFTVVLEQGGVPQAGQSIVWSAADPPFPAGPLPPVLTDANGEASVTLTPNAAGTFPASVAAVYDPDGIPANGDELDVHFDVTVSIVRTLTLVSGDNQTANAGTAFALPLDVLAEDSGTPVAGLLINWTLVSGSAIVDDAPLTDPTGHSTAAITASAPGPIQIRAERSDDPAQFVVFNLNAVAAPYLLTAVSPNPATGTVGTAMPVTVELTQGGAPVPGATIQWAAGTPFAPASSSGATDAGGQATASFTPSAPGSFTAAIVATYDPDGIPANGDEVEVNFDATVGTVATLAITGGNGQSALAGSAFALPLQVLAEDSGNPAAGIGITWTVTGDATVTASGATDASGNASATATAGSTAGPVAVTATRQDDPGVSVTFNLNVTALGTLTIAAGDGQTLQSGVASAPLQVELTDAGGLPVAGATIDWTTSTGTLASATSVTDAAGIASNSVTTTTAGKVTVTASSPLAAAPAVFALNGGLANLAGLDPVQTEVAEAIDALCPALAAMATLTPEQADLLARCRELTEAGGIDPAAAIDAIDELMTDVARAQGNAAMLAMQAQFQNLKTRIAALRSGTQGTSFGGLAINTSTGPISLETLSSAFAAEEETGPATSAAAEAEIGADFSRWGFFASGTIGRGEADEGRIDPAFDYDINGITAGVDYRKGDNLIFGGAFGYTRQDTDLPDGRGGIETSGWSLSAYGTYYTANSWYADAVLTMGRNDYDMVRHIEYTVPLSGGGTSTIAQTARANAGGDLLSAAFTAGRDFNRGALGIGPYARLLYTRLGFDAIEEELMAGTPGSGLGLRVEERELTSLATQIGGKLTYTHSTDWGVLMPHLQLEWEHEFKDDPQAIEARFLNDPTGTGIFVRGDEMDTDYFRIGLGLSMVLTKGRSGFVYYEHLLGRDGYSQWNLALGLRLEF